MDIQPLKMMEKLKGLVNKYWQDVWESKRNGNPVAWCSGGPLEILRAMDITVVNPEGYGATCSVAGLSTELCQRAEAAGYSPDLCSIIRSFVGVTHGALAPRQETLPYGGLPKPDFLVCVTYCPGVYKMWEEYSRFFNVPLFIVGRPRLHDGLTKGEVAHLVREGANELREMITFLEKLTGRRLDYDRLSQSLALEREASRLWLDTLEMCRNIPAPMSVFDAFTNIFPFNWFRGTAEAVTYYQELKAEISERVAQHVSPMTEEKYRLYWDNLPVFFKIPELTRKFASYGAVPVVAMFPYLFHYPDLAPERPLESLAEIFLFTPNNRGLKGRIEFVTKLVEGYSLDGFVMQRTRTCLVNNVGQDDIMKALIEKTGLPAVVIEGDVCDSRFYSDSEVNSKIDAFMEVLAERGPRRN